MSKITSAKVEHWIIFTWVAKRGEAKERLVCFEKKSVCEYDSQSALSKDSV